jgi:hypothetical protein
MTLLLLSVLSNTSFLTGRSTFAFYADPGSGTLIWQLLVGASVGVIFYGRLLWRRIVGRFQNPQRDLLSSEVPDKQ